MSDVEQWEHDAQRAMENEIERLREQNKQLKAELKSIDGALNDPRANLTLTTSEIIWELKAQVEKLTKERDELVNAIDNEMVVTHMGVFNAGDDPKVALNKIYCYAQDLGEFFAEDACKEQLAALAEQNEKLREALVDCEQALDECRDYPITYDSVIEALSLPNLASPVLNRIRADGMKEAFLLYSPDDTAQDWVDKILARADELEASSHD